jgi:hypothetical protein
MPGFINFIYHKDTKATKQIRTSVALSVLRAFVVIN